MTDELSLVPPQRLGALLTEHRTKRGLTIHELHLNAGLGFTPDELRRIEQGQLPLTDSQVNRLLLAYNADAGPVVPERTDLVIDITTGAMFAGQRTKVLPENPDLDDILGRYLSLLYLMRGLEPGRRLTLRGDDLEVLAGALERTITEVEGRLFELMLPGQASPWFRRLRHRLAVPAAGIMVGLTTVGSLVLVQFPNGERPVISGDKPGTAVAATLDTGSVTLTSSQETASVAVGADLAAGPTQAPVETELGPATAVTRRSAGDDPGAVSYEPGNPESVGTAAEAFIAYQFRGQLPGWTITYTGPRNGFRGNTNTVSRTITVYVSASDDPVDVAGVLAHEVGHAIDVMYLDDADRGQWLDARALDAAWWPDSGANDFHLGAGDFAEAVAVLIADSPSDADAGAFSAAQLDLARSLIPGYSQP